MASARINQQEELDRIDAELLAEHEDVERAALERGDPELPDPAEAGAEPPLPEGAAPIEPALSPPPGTDQSAEPAEDQDGDQRELSDAEVVLLFGEERLDPFSADIEQDLGYDPLTSKPAVFR